MDKTAGSKTIMPSFPAFNILTVCSSEKVVSEESVIRRVITLLITLSSLTTFSEEHTVKMLNAGKEGMMVFEPAVLSIKKGDTVKFIATDMSHNSSSVEGMIPGSYLQQKMNYGTYLLL